MMPVFRFFGGRSTFFALAMFAAGVVLAATRHLDGNFIALAGVIQALVVARAISGDKEKRPDGD